MHIASSILAPSSSVSTSVANTEWALTLLGPSTCMSQLWVQVRHLAPHVRTALLAGTPDSGQESVARLMLDLSPNPRRPFLALDAAAAEDRLARASAMTAVPAEAFLFLPELEKLSPAAQETLLRLLRARRQRAFSVVAATNGTLKTEVSMGRFSPELAELLGTVRIVVPSLADRKQDVPMLLTHLLSHRSRSAGQVAPELSEDLLRAAMKHAWAGSLGELSSVVDRLIEGAVQGDSLGAEAFDRAVACVKEEAAKPSVVRMIKLDAVIQEHVCAVLQGCRGNKLKAAEILGISRSTLYRMLEETQNNSLPLAS